MTELAVRVSGLGKAYRIASARRTARYDTLQDELLALPSVLLGRLRGRRRLRETVWALRDINLDVQQGEVLGIIGRNGAGKSTLLKILSRITEPTTGRAEIYGRVGSLLEVGTGFHHELTGRENIYLSGAVLGMTRQEVRRKFDEIVDFAGTEQYLDTPAKFYSSGMYMRLAFAVAAHLEPEILVVDEVLAVGDAEFQRKCLGKMGEVAQAGRTVFFVSHNMPAVQALCTRAIELSKGALVSEGPTPSVVADYLSNSAAPPVARRDLSRFSPRAAGEEPAIQQAWFENENGEETDRVVMGAGLTICYRFQATRAVRGPGFGFGVEDAHGMRLFSANNYMMPGNVDLRFAQSGIARCTFPSVPLQPGQYYVSLSLVEDSAEYIDLVERVLSFVIEPSDVLGSGRLPTRSQGILYVPARVEVTGAAKSPAS